MSPLAEPTPSNLRPSALTRKNPGQSATTTAKLQTGDDLSMNVFELLGMVVTAWAMTVHAGARPEDPGQSILIRRDNMSDVDWVRQEQHLGQGALDLTSAVLASSSLEGPLRNRLNAITRQVPGLGPSFVG